MKRNVELECVGILVEALQKRGWLPDQANRVGRLLFRSIKRAVFFAVPGEQRTGEGSRKAVEATIVAATKEVARRVI